MTAGLQHVGRPPAAALTPAPVGLLQRACACGGKATAGGECDKCRDERAVTLQPKLRVNDPGDEWEREADRAAEAVMAGGTASVGTTAPGGVVRRWASGPVSAEAPPVVHDVLASPGEPLGAAERGFFGPRFGHDFGRVRVHADGRAAESAAAVGARAYTVGRNVVFGAGQYAPGTTIGQKLIAHELAHVVQQRNAAYPAGGLTLADSTCEREADAAAEAVVAGRPAPVTLRAGAGLRLARQPLYTETLKAPPDAAGRTVDVTRAVKPGKCMQVPETRTSSSSEITRTRAAIELSYCRGRTSGSAKGDIDYSDVTNTIKRAVNAAPNFLTNPNPQAIRDLEQAFQQAAPRANVKFEFQVGGTKVGVTGTGTASVEGGASGTAGATVSGSIGKTGVGVGVEVSGGTRDETRVGVTATVTPGGGGPAIPDCFKCVCKDPTITFTCVVHEPDAPGKPPPQPKPVLYVPLFFEYEKAVPREGREADYEKAVAEVVGHLRGGYTIARIEGRTSPEGPLKAKRKGGFENRALALSRAEAARDAVQAALARAIRAEEFKFRDRDPGAIRRLREAQQGGYEVKGLPPGGGESSAELFGTGAEGEVAERDLLKHLKQTLKVPQEGQPDPLAAEHVIGEGLPADVRAEVEAEVEVFRTGKRDGKKLNDAELLETIYRPLRRALVVLNPPALPAPEKPFLVGEQLSKDALEKVTGKLLDKCFPEHEALFAGKVIPGDKLYEGECREKGSVSPVK